MNSNIKFPKMNYIGNKEKLVEWISEYIPNDVESIFDGFAGGNSVSFELKKKGYRIISNDIMKINSHIGNSLIQNDSEKLNDKDISKLLNLESNIKGFAYKNYSNKFFYENECIEIDTIVNNIFEIKNKYKQSLAWCLLRRALIRKMPYSRFTVPWEKIKQLRDEDYSYKKYGRKRAYHNKSVSEHILDNLESYNESIFDNNKKNKVHNKDIFDLLPKVKTDLIYLDPPYTGTMNNYFSFYHIFDELIEQKKLNLFDNNFMNKSKSIELFEKLFSKLSNFKYCILSYNSSSYPTKEVLKEIIEKYFDKVEIIEKNHNYQVSGKINKERNREFLFIGKINK